MNDETLLVNVQYKHTLNPYRLCSAPCGEAENIMFKVLCYPTGNKTLAFGSQAEVPIHQSAFEPRLRIFSIDFKFGFTNNFQAEPKFFIFTFASSNSKSLVFTELCEVQVVLSGWAKLEQI